MLISLNEAVLQLEDVAGGQLLDDAGQISLRLESLSEAALLNGDISLEVIDLMNQARQRLNSSVSPGYSSYRVPVFREGRRGRPKFQISEDQLLFFKGILNLNLSQYCEYPFTKLYSFS